MAQMAMKTRARSSGPIEVLLVDDDPIQREMYSRRLGRNGCEVRIAQSADDAASEVRRKQPDVVVLDIAMPGRDGLSALQELLDIAPSLPVVIHTAYPSFADNFIAWAADAYIAKSSDLAPLLEAIDTCVPHASLC